LGEQTLHRAIYTSRIRLLPVTEGVHVTTTEARLKLLIPVADDLLTEDLVVLLAGTERASGLVARHGVPGLSLCSEAELVADGLTPAAAHKLACAFELGRRLAERPIVRGEELTSTLTVFERFHPRMRDLKVEQFWILVLDAKSRVRRELMVSQGTLTNSLVHPREVFRLAMREAANGIVLVHNHPSGDAEPSAEDQEITKRLAVVGELVGIRVLDHVVIGDGSYVSFLERGWLVA
jgi:DNA repair protein RadC